MQPTWLVDGLAVVMLLTALYCVGRLVTAWLWNRATHVDVDIAHVAMGVAMAGMLVPSLQSLPSGVWELLFGALALWFALQIVHFVRRWGVRGWDDDHLHHASHYVTHLAMVVAMLYMFLALPMGGATAMAPGGTSAMGVAGSGAVNSGLPLIFTFVLLVAAVWYGDSLTRFARIGAGGPAPSVSGDLKSESVLAAGANARAVGTLVASTSVGGRVRPTLTGAIVLRASDRRWLAPRLEIATHITMCFTMSYMLIVGR